MGACYSKKAAKAALKRHRMERPTKKGQRGSGTNNNNNNNSKRSGAPYSRGGTSSDDQSREHQRLQKEDHHPQQSHPGSGSRSSRRAMKIGVKDDSSKTRTPNLNTPLARTRSGSRSSGGSSPAGLHGRAPHKTAVVAPAPSKFTPKASSLNRFGFRNGGQVKSGDSTDSVNSILSDAQTISDSNSNIFDLCDDDNNDNNKSTNRNSDSACDNSRVRSKRLESVESLSSPGATTPKVPYVPKQTAGAQSNRITAFTRQLPKPQVVSVRAVSPKTSTPARSSSPKTHSPLSHVSSSSKTKSPSVKSLIHTPLKSSLDQTPRQPSSNAGLRTPRVSRDSESSTKSGVEADSGLGSSSESDKIRGEGETDTLDSSNVESTEDMSDAWLKKTRQQQHQGLLLSKRKSKGSMEIQFNGTSSFEVKKQSLEVREKETAEAKAKPSPVQTSQENKSEACKDKRDNVITYGMARQKFAPYSRSRYGYGYQSRTVASPASATPSGGSGSPSPGVTKISGSSGLVRSRVAMIETPQTKKTQQQQQQQQQQTPILRRTNLKKPLIRPTSLEKTPILVMPVTEKTVELSKPVCRKLEYSENTNPNARRDSSDGESQEGKEPVVGDILMVGSVEVETHKDSNVVLEADNHGSFYENLYDKIPVADRNDIAFKGNPDFGIRISESKAYNDSSENEKRTCRETRVSKEQVTLDAQRVIEMCRSPESVVENGEVDKSVPETPDDSGIKLLSPQSESSFEILESLSETTDLTAEEEAKGVSQPNPRGVGEENVAARAPSVIPEAKRESSVDSTSSSEATTVAPTDKIPKSSLKPKPKPMSKSAECVKSSNNNSVKADKVERQHSHDIPATKSKNGMVAERKKPPPSAPLLSGKSSSSDLRSSMESSVESHKSLGGVVSVMTDSGELSNLSGKCTPNLNTNRSDLDQDFLIDDEIADQPALMFGGSTMGSSFFGDDGLFDDIASSPPSHSQLKQVIAGSSRSRANSVDTTSSVGGDDLMLDYFDMEEAKAGGYEEEVLSPDASEIFSEWTAMMAEVSSTVSERCVSREGSSGGGRTSRPRLSSSSELSSPDPRRPTVLRPPRQSGGVTEVEGSGGGVFVDRTSYHYMCQDVTSLKTMLLRLRRVLQAADTINPFDANLRNSLYLSLASSSNDSPMCSPGINGDKDSLTPSVNELSQENVDLRRQVVLLQQQLEERDRTIRLLHQQLAQNIESQQQQAKGCTPPEAAAEVPGNVMNAATQTERSSRSGALTGSSISRTASIDDGLGPTVSSEVECSHMGRGRSTSAPDRRQPRAASQPPAQFTR